MNKFNNVNSLLLNVSKKVNYKGDDDEIDILNAISLFINNLNSSQEQDCNLPLVSMGYSIYHKSEGSIEQAISKADAQLYRYKKLHKQETKEPGKTNCNFSCSLTERTPH